MPYTILYDGAELGDGRANTYELIKRNGRQPVVAPDLWPLRASARSVTDHLLITAHPVVQSSQLYPGLKVTSRRKFATGCTRVVDTESCNLRSSKF